MPFRIENKAPGCIASLKAALFGLPESMVVSATGMHQLNRPGIGEGQLVGGNLSILYAMRGTPYDLDTSGKILFIEDLDELLYHVDRMVMNLKLGGLFDDLAGLVVGSMSEMHDKDPLDPFGLPAEAIIRRALGSRNYPVCFNFPAGHIQDNRALVLGQSTKLNVTPEGATLSVV